MASYESWNCAIATYFTSGSAKGTPIFLSVDSEAIEEIAARFLPEPVKDNPLHDFLAAVRQKCKAPFREEIILHPFRASIDGMPGCIGFLGTMVLAAYNMHDDNEINESNYFSRLRELLHLPMEVGRPEGMKPPGVEEPFWESWNRYLIDLGFLDTSERGSGPQTYLRYVFSQAILRESDKQYLRRRFHDDHLPLQFDCDQLGFWLSRKQINRKHLLEGLHHSEPGRVWEFYQAAYRVYQDGDWIDGIEKKKMLACNRLRNIESGLYLIEDLLGNQQYWLLPRQPVRMPLGQLTVKPPNGDFDQAPLRPLRAGFFSPLWPQIPFINEALECSVCGDPCIQKLLFPKRHFWILMRDPENPYGAWATWKPYPELGEHLLVLCRKGPFELEMVRFKETKLLDWTNRVECEEWVEYHGCMVLSYDWGGFICTPECIALANALAPRTMANISLLGGLRDPNQNTWLEGFPPDIKVYGFEQQLVKS